MRILAVLLLVSACTADSLEVAQPLSTAAIPRGSTWRYWDRGGDLGAAWRGTFDDAAWASGAGPLGYGESYLGTTVGYGPSSSSKYITTYFRRTFTVDDPATVTKIAGEVMYDDGFVVYLNGVEIARAAMPTGTVTASTRSTGHEANNAYRTFDWTAQAGRLVAGTNVIAVEVHQVDPGSSDLVFDLGLTLDTESAPVPVAGIERESYWNYWDQGGDLGTAWRMHDCCSDGWTYARGSFGYGESYLRTTVGYGPSSSSKYITTYFTTSIWLSNPGSVTKMIGEVMYDDGFVAYLNGVEIARAAMPTGPVTASTRSTGHEANATYQTFDLSAYRGLLVTGQNVLAVEVHQVDASSSDLVFDMGLELTGEAPPPPSTDEDIARGSVWRYWDRAEAPSEYHSWADPEFNDATWASGAGPLGYGESYLRTTLSYGSDPAHKPITAYFRRWITVDHPSVQTTLVAELMYDDGLVVYLNGREVARRSMPAGNVDPTTRALGHEASNRYETIDLGGYLVRGPNLLAVEVHQTDPTSSDLVFDLAVQVDTPAVCAIPGGGPAVAPAPYSVLGAVWVGPGAAWVAGGTAIGRRDDATGAWCWAEPDPGHGWSAVWGSADDDVWFVGGGGAVLHYDGTKFEPVDLGTTLGLRDVGGTGPADVWIVGAEGTVRHFDGATWQSRSLPTDQSLLTVWAASANDVWIGGTEPAPYPGNPEYDGSSGVIYRWDPATAGWTLEVRHTRYYGYADYSDLRGTSASNIWAVGGDHPAGAACSYSGAAHFDGTTWSSVAFPHEENGCRGFEEVEPGAPGAEDGTWIVGYQDGKEGALRYTGGVWSAAESPITDGLLGIDHRGSRLLAAGIDWNAPHKIVRWDGARWVRDW